MVAQECVKAITGKFSPLNQLFYFNAMELLPELPKKKDGEEKEEVDVQKNKEKSVEEGKQNNKEKEQK